MVLKDLQTEFADLVYENYLKEMYSVSACKSDYSESKVQELRLLIGWLASGVKCPEKHVTINASKGPIQPLAITNVVGRTLAMTWVQSNPAGTWVITHNLGYNPVVEVYDNEGWPVPGTVKYLGPDTLQILFQSIVGGKAYLYTT